MHARRLRKALLALVALAALTAGVLASASGPAGATGSNSIATPDTGVAIGASLALDASGNPVVSYYDTSNFDLKVLHCGDANCSAGNTITLPDTAGDVGSDTSLALDAGGNPVISYTDGTTRYLKLLHCNDPNCAGGDESITSPDPAVNYAGVDADSLALDASGSPVVSYLDTNGSLKVLHCNDPNCVGTDESITSPDPAVVYAGGGSSLALDASGNPVVSYSESGRAGLKLLHCGNPACTSGNSIATLHTEAGGGLSLVLDTSGNPVVSYSEEGYGPFVLHCGNPFCTSGNTFAAPSLPGGDFGTYAPLALDASGNPVMSYWAEVTGGLRVLHCDDPTCTSGITVAAPDAMGLEVASHMSLALDARGNPVVSYFGNGRLKVLHCGDPTCFASKFPGPPFSFVFGDVDCSQAVTSIDALLVLQFSAGLLSSLVCPWLANVYNDENVNSLDATIILQYVAGLIPSVPVSPDLPIQPRD